MSSVPFPSFTHTSPVSENRAVALAAVGRCRIFPLTCSDGVFQEIIQNIFQKTVEQASVDELVEGSGPEERKKLKKRLMKESVSIAQKFLFENLKLDASIIDIEMVVESSMITQSDGYIASCFLDAGCDKIVIPIHQAEDINALRCARIPKERLAALFYDAAVLHSILADHPSLSSICAMVDTLGVVVLNDMGSIESSITSLRDAMLPGTDTTLNLHIPCSCATSTGFSYTDADELASKVGSLLSSSSKTKLTVSLVDPNASQLGKCFASCIRTDRVDKLYTTVVCTRSGEALGLVYSSIDSIIAALECGRGVYYSRSRSSLWRKGDTSGHYQDLHRIDVDCDGDALRFTVTQRCGNDVKGAFCHLNTLTCWGNPRGVRHLEETVRARLVDAPSGSYTKRLFDDDTLLRDKLVEEAQELAEATDKTHVAEELADILYFAMVKAVKAGVSIDDAVEELDKRSRKVTRRQGDSKDFRIAAANAILKK